MKSSPSSRTLRVQGEAGGRGSGGIPPAERIFTPALIPGGALANTLIGQVIGVGPERGIDDSDHGPIPLHPRIRRVEIELPEAVTSEPDVTLDAPEPLPG